MTNGFARSGGQNECLHLWDFEYFDQTEETVIHGIGHIRNACWKCRLCGKERTDNTMQRASSWKSVQEAMREGEREGR